MQTNEQIANVLHSSQNVAIIPADVSGTDAFCAASALFLMLRAIDKNVKIFYLKEIPEGCKELVKDYDLATSISERQLTISIDYSGEHEAKAWYEPGGELLKVKLSPVSKDFDPGTRVHAELEPCFEFDTAIVVGANTFEDLGYIYDEIKQDLAESTTINISNSSKNNRFGNINVIDPTSESLSQLVIKKSPAWELNITTQAAQALLVGITQRN